MKTTMKTFNFKKTIWFTVLIIVLIAVDQITKYIAVATLKNKESFKIIKDVFEFEYVENPGAAWGMLGGQRTFFIILTLVLIPILIIFLIRLEKLIQEQFKTALINAEYETNIDNTERFGFECKTVVLPKFALKLQILQYIVVFLISGALGNFIDRVVNAYVVDFLSFKLIDFPVFNVADCYVTCATAALIILMLFFIKGEEFDTIFPTKKRGRDI